MKVLVAMRDNQNEISKLRLTFLKFELVGMLKWEK